MASGAFTVWRTVSSKRLDELIAAHAAVGGTGRGRRYATEQLNASLVVQIAAHFQLFCRGLHTETAEVLVLAAPTSYRTMLRVAFTDRRSLDRGNASVETIGSDFARFDFDIWGTAAAASPLTSTRRLRLNQLNTWRNAIAHQDFVFTAKQQTRLQETSLTLASARRWRGACNGLASTFDQIVAAHLTAVTGTRPW